MRKVVTAGDKKELSLFQERDEFAAKLYELLDLHWGDLNFGDRLRSSSGMWALGALGLVRKYYSSGRRNNHNIVHGCKRSVVQMMVYSTL